MQSLFVVGLKYFIVSNLTLYPNMPRTLKKTSAFILDCGTGPSVTVSLKHSLEKKRNEKEKRALQFQRLPHSCGFISDCCHRPAACLLVTFVEVNDPTAHGEILHVSRHFEAFSLQQKKKREILPPGLHHCNVRQLRNARARCAESGDKL